MVPTGSCFPMKARGGALGAAFVALLALAVPAAAEPRVALVIGNSAYQGDLPALPNPANDAKLMAKALKGVGFDVVEAENASQDQMKKAIAEFGDKLSAAGNTATGLFFYAGHGLQVAGENYLVPVDAKIQKEADVDLAAVSTTTVLKQMDFAGSAVNIVILDACRNNPLSNGARGMTRGLAEIKSTPRGSFIAYSTAPGSTAQDGDGADSPYTTALAETIQEPGLSISDVFQEVRTKVLAATGNAQTTWDSSSLTGRFYFNPPEAGATQQTASLTPPANGTAAPANSAVDALDTEKTFWDSVKDSKDPDEIQMYLTKYPKGYFVDLANAKLQELKGGTQVASAATNSAATNSAATITPQPVQPNQPAPSAQSVQMGFVARNQTVYATGGGQVRAQPDSRTDLLAKLQTNAEVHATGLSEDGSWWRVTTADGHTGYMHRSVVSEQPIQLAAAAAPQQGFTTQTAPANSSSIEMLSNGAAQQPASAPSAGSGPNIQQVGQAVSAALSGNGQTLSGLLSGAAQSAAQQPQTPQMQFAPINKTITARGGANILGMPQYGATPIARLTADTALQAMARTPDLRWWQVALPNGSTGYLEGRFIQQ